MAVRIGVLSIDDGHRLDLRGGDSYGVLVVLGQLLRGLDVGLEPFVVGDVVHDSNFAVGVLQAVGADLSAGRVAGLGVEGRADGVAVVVAEDVVAEALGEGGNRLF